MKTENILVLENVSKYINGRQILDDISFYVRQGEVVGLLGPNGAGKTTILKLITHLLFADEGSIFFDGCEMGENYEMALGRMGTVIGASMLYDELTGFENLRLRGRMFKKIDKASIEMTSRMFHVDGYLHRKCREYSMGMRQRLSLAVACLSQPELLILDEPMNGLDPEGLKQLSKELSQMARESNVAILISSHLLYDVENLCDRVLFVKDGKLIGEEQIREIQSRGESLSELYFNKMEKEDENVSTIN